MVKDPVQYSTMMANSNVNSNHEVLSNDNSTKEFLLHEKSCETFKDSDEEIKMIFSEIQKLSSGKNKDCDITEDIDDVDLILKRAEVLAHETQHLLKSSPVACISTQKNTEAIPVIKVTKASEEETRSPTKAVFEEKVSHNILTIFLR